LLKKAIKLWIIYKPCGPTGKPDESELGGVELKFDVLDDPLLPEGQVFPLGSDDGALGKNEFLTKRANPQIESMTAIAIILKKMYFRASFIFSTLALAIYLTTPQINPRRAIPKSNGITRLIVLMSSQTRSLRLLAAWVTAGMAKSGTKNNIFFI
jgi:hypothetical protein